MSCMYNVCNHCITNNFYPKSRGTMQKAYLHLKKQEGACPLCTVDLHPLLHKKNIYVSHNENRKLYIGLYLLALVLMSFVPRTGKLGICSRISVGQSPPKATVNFLYKLAQIQLVMCFKNCIWCKCNALQMLLDFKLGFRFFALYKLMFDAAENSIWLSKIIY